MTTAAVEPIFLDTNILVYASWSVAPLHSQALAAIQHYEAAGVPLWMSRQVLREYLATLVRPRVGIPIATLTTEVRQFAARFQMVEDGPLVTERLLALLEQGLSTQIHDTNIVATMQIAGIRQILTNNPTDFAPFASLITVIPLM